MDESSQQEKITLTDALRVRFKKLLDSIGAFLNGLGITPNTLTISGLVGNLIGAYFLAIGSFMVGGLILLFMGAIDALDCGVSRATSERLLIQSPIGIRNWLYTLGCSSTLSMI